MHIGLVKRGTPSDPGLTNMSMEIYVLSDSELLSMVAWQAAIRAEGFALHLSTGVQLDAVRGFLPAQLGDRLTGFECYHDDACELMNVYGHLDVGRRWRAALGLRFAGDFNELLAAWMAATAYARATGGVVFDPQESKMFTPQQAREVTQDIEKDRPTYELAMRNFAAKLSTKSNDQ